MQFTNALKVSVVAKAAVRVRSGHTSQPKGDDAAGLSSLRTSALTFDTCHLPPRRVRMPRRVSSAAMARKEV